MQCVTFQCSLGVLAGVSVLWHSPSQGRNYAVHCTVTKVTSGIAANMHPKYCKQKNTKQFCHGNTDFADLCKTPFPSRSTKSKVVSAKHVFEAKKHRLVAANTCHAETNICKFCQSGTVAAIATLVAHSLKEEVAVPILFLFDPPGQGGQPNRSVRKMGSQMPRSMTPHGMTWTQQKNITLKKKML